MTKVSVIIPVYNVEKYLRQCLDSVVNQTLKEIEVVCVDDGSTDGSPAILAEYAAKDPRVKVLTREKSNAGAARNAGLDLARGEWLFFCDADDTMTSGLFERLVSVAETKAADVVISGFKQREDGVVTDRMPPARLIQHAAPDAAGDCPPFLFVDAGVSPWNKLFRRDLVTNNRLRFQEVSRHNDLLFVCLALAYSRNPVAISTCGYLYRRGRTGSLTGQKTSCDAFVDVLLTLRRELESRGLWRRAGAAFLNAALAHCCYHLLGGGDSESFSSLYRALHGHALADLGLDPIPDGRLIDRRHVAYLKAILASPDPTGLWMILLSERYQAWKAIVQRSARIRELETSQTKLSESVTRADARVLELERVAEGLKEELVQTQSDLVSSRGTVDRLLARIGELERSRAYRLGQIMRHPTRLLDWFRRRMI